MADVDSHGRVIQFEQVLDVQRFALVTPGATRDGVLRTIGQPSDRAPLRDGEMWAWRYANRYCVWYQIELDQHGVVKATGYKPEPGCNDVAGSSSKRVGAG
jgi:outer membrane protein assembly factor BamE (lipoprotein component of BamABCDE complex)